MTSNPRYASLLISYVYQKILWDRRKVYQVLKKHNVPMATHYFVNRKDTPEIT